MVTLLAHGMLEGANAAPVIAVLVILLAAAVALCLIPPRYLAIAPLPVLAAATLTAVAFLPATAGKVAIGIFVLIVVLIGIPLVPILRASSGNSDGSQRYLVILGAKVNGAVPSKSLDRRLEGALAYLEASPESIVIASGGRGNAQGTGSAAFRRAVPRRILRRALHQQHGPGAGAPALQLG